MSSQQNRRKGGHSTTPEDLAEKLAKIMLEKERAASNQHPGERLDAIERALMRHPGLTRAEAQEMADECGF
jgi:hypothetical protein